MIKTNLKKDSEKHNCSMTSMYAVHMHENKKKENKLLRNLLCNLLRNLLRNPLNLTWPCTKDSQNLLRDLLCNLLQNPLKLTWLCTIASSNLLRNLLRNPLLNLTGSAPKPPRPSPEPLNLPWLCTKASPTFSGNLVELDPAPAPVHTRAILAEDPMSLSCWGINI